MVEPDATSTRASGPVDRPIVSSRARPVGRAGRTVRERGTFAARFVFSRPSRRPRTAQMSRMPLRLSALPLGLAFALTACGGAPPPADAPHSHQHTTMVTVTDQA